MNKNPALVVAIPLLLAGCTSMRVTGDITDAATGDVIAVCGVTSGPRHISADGSGHFVIKVRRSWSRMDVVCAGYEPQPVEFGSSPTRYPSYSIRMAPRRVARQSSRAESAARAAEPAEQAAAPLAAKSAEPVAKHASRVASLPSKSATTQPAPAVVQNGAGGADPSYAPTINEVEPTP